MRAFFWLSREIDRKHKDYREGVHNLARQIALEPVFADSAQDLNVDWVAEQLGGAEFAFFDVTAAAPDCLIALGMALENEAQCFALRDPDVKPAFAAALVPVRDYFGPADFARKVRAIITEVQGASTIQQRQLVEHIKQKVAKHGSLPLRGIAQELGRHPADIRPLVYSMVAERMLTKISAGLGTRCRSSGASRLERAPSGAQAAAVVEVRA
jgi:hypothetical protein